MKTLVTGGTGFIGHKLLEQLALRGHDLVVLSRNAESAAKQIGLPVTAYPWQPTEGAPPIQAFEGVASVVHLAGESVADGRWTRAKRHRILESRRLGTRHLVEGIKKHGHTVKQFVCASAIGIYGHRGAEWLEETSEEGKGFLADVCRVWEQEANAAPVRTVNLRIGLVLGREGALGKLLPLFRLRLGGKVGTGNQYMSWIHVDDVVGLIEHALNQPELRGPVNATTPHPVTNKEFTQTLAEVLGVVAPFPAPGIALRIVLGQMAELALKSQRIRPAQALHSGYRFQHTELRGALKALVPSPTRRLEEAFTVHQWLDRPVSDVFPFFADARNLEKITPKWLHFRVEDEVDENIHQGQKISYRLKIRHVPVRWQSLIEQWNPNKMFVDTQIKGPYKLWHHTHTFVPLKEGTLIMDHVRYQVPGGALGSLLLGPWIRSDLRKIFAYRKQVIEQEYRRD